MTICKNCKSINVRVGNLDFAKAKPEGVVAAKYDGPNHDFYCDDCRSQWQSGPEDWKLYYEYKNLAYKNKLTAHNMPADGSYQVQYLGEPIELDRIRELAKILLSSYRHLIVLNPGEWHEIEQDSKE